VITCHAFDIWYRLPAAKGGRGTSAICLGVRPNSEAVFFLLSAFAFRVYGEVDFSSAASGALFYVGLQRLAGYHESSGWMSNGRCYIVFTSEAAVTYKLIETLLSKSRAVFGAFFFSHVRR
jgi:hypothetical protein